MFKHKLNGSILIAQHFTNRIIHEPSLATFPVNLGSRYIVS